MLIGDVGAKESAIEFSPPSHIGTMIERRIIRVSLSRLSTTKQDIWL